MTWLGITLESLTLREVNYQRAHIANKQPQNKKTGCQMKGSDWQQKMGILCSNSMTIPWHSQSHGNK